MRSIDHVVEQMTCAQVTSYQKGNEAVWHESRSITGVLCERRKPEQGIQFELGRRKFILEKVQFDLETFRAEAHNDVYHSNDQM